MATVFGAGGGTNSYREIEETDCVLLWGSNARETHPIFFHHLLKGVRNGARLYAVDPRRTSSAKWAHANDSPSGGALRPWPRSSMATHRRCGPRARASGAYVGAQKPSA